MSISSKEFTVLILPAFVSQWAGIVLAIVLWLENNAEATMIDLFSKAQAAIEAIRERTQLTPRVGIILGSGLGAFAAQVADAVAIPYAEIPHFPQSTVVGHSGKLLLGKISDVAVAVMQGRRVPHSSLFSSDGWDAICSSREFLLLPVKDQRRAPCQCRTTPHRLWSATSPSTFTLPTHLPD